MNRMDEEDYYAMLGVPQNATATEIKSAFNRKALLTHPDKNRQHAAGFDMAKLNEAKTVLLDDTKRRLYDQYGVLGLSMLDNMRQKTPREILEELERRNKEKMVKDIKSQVGASGSLTVGYDATKMFGGKKFEWPRFSMFSFNQTFECKPHRKLTLGLGASVGGANHPRGLSFTIPTLHTSAQYQFSRTMVGSIYMKRNLFGPVTVGTQIAAQMSSTITGRISIEGKPGEEGFNQDGLIVLHGTKSFSDTTGLFVELRAGAQNHFETGLYFDAFGMSMNVKAETTAEDVLGLEEETGLSAQVGVSAKRDLTRHTSFEADLTTSALLETTLTFGFYVHVLDYTKIGVCAQLGVGGASIIFKYKRLGHKLEFPITFAAEWMPKVALMCAAAPCFFIAFAKVMLHLSGGKEVLRNAEVHEAKWQTHLKTVENLRQDADEKVRIEPHGGLVITRANYGNFKADEEDQKKYYLVVDVTVPIRAQIKNRAPKCGCIEIGRMSKSGLPGFYDTDPGQPKHLEVWYTLGGVMYYVKVADTEKLQIPRPEHRVAGTTE
eukprot:TRINITY_DN10381_c0_g1_i2.p1 TRINITY_DN10381_c0_g1~~TRINITY_DN10381_c0_g1_i2.p1  ORF type:complete len:549 (-),score=105.31 TRINITY_DN10381_c0_g1_i2:5-1651(-)